MKKYTEREVRFAKAIFRSGIDSRYDSFEGERTYYCNHCDADSLEVSDDEADGVNVYETFHHEDNCIMLEAMEIIKDSALFEALSR